MSESFLIFYKVAYDSFCWALQYAEEERVFKVKDFYAITISIFYQIKMVARTLHLHGASCMDYFRRLQPLKFIWVGLHAIKLSVAGAKNPDSEIPI